MRDHLGFTLIEVMVAIVILTVGILTLFTMHVTAINANMLANRITTSSTWAGDRIETLLSRPYDCKSRKSNCHDLDDDNGNGTDQDLNEDGTDDNGGNFGLDELGPRSDGRAVSPDGFYTIFWNVGVDTPVLNCKTIRVIVQRQDRGMTKTNTMTYIKYRD